MPTAIGRNNTTLINQDFSLDKSNQPLYSYPHLQGCLQILILGQLKFWEENLPPKRREFFQESVL